VWACFQSAARAPTRAGRLYLAGLGVWIGIGALMNLSMAVGLMPTMGLPLPFVSAGGSALVSLMAAVGIGVALAREKP
jgi:cell division protein FtsW (lipid II flippase)